MLLNVTTPPPVSGHVTVARDLVPTAASRIGKALNLSASAGTMGRMG